MGTKARQSPGLIADVTPYNDAVSVTFDAGVTWRCQVGTSNGCNDNKKIGDKEGDGGIVSEVREDHLLVSRPHH